MDIQSPGQGVVAARAGEVTNVTDTEITVAGKTYQVTPPMSGWRERLDDATHVIPAGTFWQEPVVEVGDNVKKKELLAKGITHLYFQANIWIFTGLVFIVGIMMGIGKAAVYKHIPDYFPDDVGVVGGIVGVVGGLGGFFCPIIFGYLLKATGIWTTCWMFFAVLSIWCLWWMHRVIQRMMRQKQPVLMRQIEDH
jgi:NNP family nitrate/nitrite transporter-like MFS transporter